MPKCNFCGKQLVKGMGKMFVYSNGKIAHFCTLKCEKNLLVLKRKPLQTKWTEAYHSDKTKTAKPVKKEETKPVDEVKEDPKVEEPVKEEKTEALVEEESSAEEVKEDSKTEEKVEAAPAEEKTEEKETKEEGEKQ